MEMILVTPERKAELERLAHERGKTLDDAVDEALAAYLEWERLEQEETVAGIRRGYEDVTAGRTRPAQEFLDELRHRHGISR